MESYSITNVGRVRNVNQDFVFASDTPVGNLPNLYVVADGMGGHNAGDRASSYAVEVFLDSIRKETEERPIKIIRRAIEKANAKVLEEAASADELRGMGTTIVAATVVGRTMYVANVGDSRLYLLRNRIRQITRDHSLVEEMIRAGGITREEGRRHPDKNVITRAVGVRAAIAADFFEEELRDGDTVLMCTDGLSNMVTDREIARIINEEHDLETMANRLVATANQNGGQDNITVLLFHMQMNEVKKC
ncbi:MAG: Stp1/IreP family PP2C-type Ser/Thr phosphatase [Eubacteriales bacterium]|nr:Stp1/IreP family PP2C-type Ser/Thr phosphatase [Eubacteriales bacterium]